MNYGKPVRTLTARERRIRSKYVAMFVVAALTALSLGAILNRKNFEVKGMQTQIKQLKLEIDSINHIKDSLHDENFVNSINVGRYEVTLELLRERDRKAAEKFEYIMSHETE